MKIKVLLILIILCFSCSYSHWACATKDKNLSEPNQHAKADNSYFPLSLGCYWKYRCSAEGEFQFEKTIRIVSISTYKGITLYKVESISTVDEKPFIYYLFKDKGMIFRTFDPEITEREPVIVIDPKPGDRIDKDFTISRNEGVSTPATGKVNTLVVENFNLEQAPLPTNDPMNWRGFFYAKGIGCVVESDGLGGECVLIDYKIKD